MLAVLCLWRWQQGPLHLADAVIAAGVWGAFPIIEWAVHRFMLHDRPHRILRWTLDFYLPRTHRRHHADPWNLAWVFVPLHVYPLILIPLAVTLVVADGWRPELLTAAATFVLLGLHYEWTHYLTHIAWCPPIAYYQRRVRAHRLHHFRNEKLWWGVSMGLGDRLFGTAPQAQDAPRSATIRDISRRAGRDH